MDLGDLLQPDEAIIWQGTADQRTGLREELRRIPNLAALLGASLLFLAFWLLLFSVYWHKGGLSGAVFSPAWLCLLLAAVPVCYITGWLADTGRKNGMTQYCITDKGIYIRKEPGGTGKPAIQFIAYERLRSVNAAESRYGNAKRAGNIFLEYDKRITLIDPSEECAAQYITKSVTLFRIPDYQVLFQYILEQKQLQQPEPEPEKPKKPRQKFVYQNPTLTEQEIREALSDDTVAALQAELFGDEAVRTQVFPDPSVNPLPEMPEPPEAEGQRG